jgi:hypothetical protein
MTLCWAHCRTLAWLEGGGCRLARYATGALSLESLRIFPDVIRHFLMSRCWGHDRTLNWPLCGACLQDMSFIGAIRCEFRAMCKLTSGWFRCRNCAIVVCPWGFHSRQLPQGRGFHARTTRNSRREGSPRSRRTPRNTSRLRWDVPSRTSPSRCLPSLATTPSMPTPHNRCRPGARGRGTRPACTMIIRMRFDLSEGPSYRRDLGRPHARAREASSCGEEFSENSCGIGQARYHFWRFQQLNICLSRFRPSETTTFSLEEAIHLADSPWESVGESSSRPW